jgi:hypothetical protein
LTPRDAAILRAGCVDDQADFDRGRSAGDVRPTFDQFHPLTASYKINHFLVAFAHFDN